MLVERKCRVSLNTHPSPVFLATPSLSALGHSRCEGLAKPHVYDAGYSLRAEGRIKGKLQDRLSSLEQYIGDM